MKKSVIIGITGKIATGKTHFCKLFEQIYPQTQIFNADLEAKKLLKSDQNLKSYIIKTLGSDILEENHTEISHKKLAKKIFSSQENYKKVVPRIWKSVEALLISNIDFIKQQKGILLLESALLFEAQWDKHCDKIILLEPKEETQNQYLANHNLTKKDTQIRLKFQKKSPQKNNKTIKITEKIKTKSIQSIVNKITEKQENSPKNEPTKK